MQVYTEVAPEEVAREMATDGGFAMDTLAHLAEKGDKAIKEIVAGWDSSRWHDEVAPWLRALSSALDQAKLKPDK